MHPARASLTARRTATYRAQHQRVDAVRVLDDPFAIAILGDDAVEPVDHAGAPEQAVTRFYLAARARLAEDALAAAVAEGARRYVVLGAGLDTFALRNPFPGLEVIEVDHPATQAWKRERIARAGLAPPERLSFLSVDFTTEDLAERLLTVGVGPGQPAFFSWLGVTYYLPIDAIRATLRAVAACSAGSRIVLDYYHPPETLESAARERLSNISHHVRSIGEPFVSFFTDEAIRSLLDGVGLRDVRTFDLAALFARYGGVERPTHAGFMGIAHARC